MPSAVTLDRVSVSLGATCALHDVSLTIEPGTNTALTGSNGSGKSTLLSVMAGLLRPTSGRMSRHPGTVAWVAQRSQVPDTLPVTVREVVTMGRWAHRGSWRPLTRADRSLVADTIDALGLGALADRPLSALSGGQRQRALVAQGLVQRAAVLLLDEPTIGLDDAAQELIETALAGESARGATIVHATHDPRVIARADRVVRLEAGRVALSHDGVSAE